MRKLTNTLSPSTKEIEVLGRGLGLGGPKSSDFYPRKIEPTAIN
jgi:hypothetical protein